VRQGKTNNNMDKLSKEQRHKNMAAIRSKDTKPEIIVRRWLWSRGFRYRLNHKRLPGHPDLVLRKYRTCIFVNGCFWHGHEGCKYFVWPKNNADFWKGKISSNVLRDETNCRLLTERCWNVITVWECELKKKKFLETMESLVQSIKANA
jgi:DNA mismatch endonuclease (patch repair protein)